jgi:hypothetical protein
MDMPPLTSPDKPLNPVFWRILMVLACVLVFSFALHAKVAVYSGASHPQPSTSSKLWLNGEKLQPLTAVPTVTLAWLATFLISLLCWQNIRSCKEAPAPDVREQGRQQYLSRFLRPPPLR